MPLSKQSFWVFTHPPLWMVVVEMTVSTSECARNHPLAGGLRCVPLRHDDSSWPPSVTGPYPSTVSTLTGAWRRVRKSCIYGGDNEQCL
jgi:hypothetical protein